MNPCEPCTVRVDGSTRQHQAHLGSTHPSLHYLSRSGAHVKPKLSEVRFWTNKVFRNVAVARDSLHQHDHRLRQSGVSASDWAHVDRLRLLVVLVISEELCDGRFELNPSNPTGSSMVVQRFVCPFSPEQLIRQIYSGWRSMLTETSTSVTNIAIMKRGGLAITCT